jgi:hypothetical protein
VLVVLFGLMFCSGFGVLGGQNIVSMCQMSMMTCRLVVARIMMFSGFTMMSCRVFMMFRSFFVMLGSRMLSHFLFPLESLRTGTDTGLCLSRFFSSITGTLKDNQDEQHSAS